MCVPFGNIETTDGRFIGFEIVKATCFLNIHSVAKAICSALAF
jgi:hypothetical protein